MIIELYEAISSYYIADVNTQISCINTMDFNDIKRSSSYSLKDIAKRSKLSCENIPLLEFEFMGDENLNDNTYMSRDFQTFCQLSPSFIVNKQ